MWLVTASSITEPIAASASHCSCVAMESGAARAAAGTSSVPKPFIDNRAVSAQRTTKPANTKDHIQPSCLRSSAGSNSSGNPISASNEARLESANRR